MLSHWLTEAGLSTEETAPALEGDGRADICIVGGGFCGLWTAIRLKERDPSIDIAIVEKDECGSGASGRNGGFVLSWWAKFGSLCKFCPSDEAVRLARASADAVGEIGRFCADQGIDAHYRGDGWLWAASSEPQVGSWSALVDTLERHQLHPFELWEPETVKRRSGTDRHVAGVYEPTGASVQPALLARGLRRVALSKGVRIYERTPLTRLDRSRPPRVVTPRGTLTADKVVIAMNAWATMFPELRRTIVVISSDIVATRPMPERLAASGWSDGMCISDSRTLVNYYRPTVDGRVAFGTGGGRLSFGNRVDDRFNGASPRAREVEAYFRRIYPVSAMCRSRRAGPGRSTAPSAGSPSSAASTAATTCSTASASPATAWGPPPSAAASSPRSPWARRTSGPSAGWCGRKWGSSRASRCAMSAGVW